MEEKKFESAEESTVSRSPEKKDYHAPELTVYGDMRELTMTNPAGPIPDTGNFPNTETTRL
jgi:hypothetical protein